MPLERAAHYATIGLFLILLGWVATRAAAIVSPILLAILLNYLCSPLVRWGRQRHIPGAVSSTVILVLLFGGVGVVGVQLARPAAAWVERIPESRAKVRELTRSIRERLQPVAQAAEEVESATRELDGTGRRPQAVAVEKPGVMRRMAGQVTTLAGAAVMTFFLALLLLAPGDVFQQKLIRHLPASRSRDRLHEMGGEIEARISRYLGSIVLINTGLGVVTGIAMWLLGMPNPALWGVTAALLNFIPYIGAVGTFTIIGLAALLTFDEPARALVPPLVFLGINLLESNLITPKLVERWLKLNAVTTFLAVIVLWALLGVPGALMAVPLLVITKVVCDHLEGFEGLASLIGT